MNISIMICSVLMHSLTFKLIFVKPDHLGRCLSMCIEKLHLEKPGLLTASDANRSEGNRCYGSNW